MHRTATRSWPVAVLVLTLLVSVQEIAIAVPEVKGEGNSKAQQTSDGARVQSTVQVRGLNQRQQANDDDGAGDSGTKRPPQVGPVCGWIALEGAPLIDGKELYYEHCPGRQPELVLIDPRGGQAGTSRPAVPTFEEIGDLVESKVAPPPISTNPQWGSVTGLETWLWYEGQDGVEATANIRGYSTTATMRPTAYIWEMGDGQVLQSSQPGSEESPAATHIYNTKGHYTLTLTVVWDGSWRFTGYGTSADGDLANIRVTSARPYQVNEIRSELTNTG